MAKNGYLDVLKAAQQGKFYGPRLGRLEYTPKKCNLWRTVH
jgi:hypothetical protein